MFTLVLAAAAAHAGIQAYTASHPVIRGESSVHLQTAAHSSGFARVDHRSHVRLSQRPATIHLSGGKQPVRLAQAVDTSGAAVPAATTDSTFTAPPAGAPAGPLASLDSNSVSALEQRVQAITAQDRLLGTAASDSALRHLKQRLSYLRTRAFPRDQVDWESLRRAEQQRDALPSVRLAGAAPEALHLQRLRSVCPRHTQ